MPNQTSSSSRVPSPNSKASTSSRLYEIPADPTASSSSPSSPSYMPGHRTSSSDSRPYVHSSRATTSSPDVHRTLKSLIREASSSISMANRTSSPNARASCDTSRPSYESQCSSPIFSRTSSSSSTAQNSLPRDAKSSKHSRRKFLNFAVGSARGGLSPAHSQQSEEGTVENKHQLKIVGIKVICNSNMEGRAFNPSKFLTGDIVQTVTIEGSPPFRSHFLGGKDALFKQLKQLGDNRVRRRLLIEVKRQEREISREALISKNSHRELLDLEDQSHEFTLEDYSPQECQFLQEEERRRMEEQVLSMRVVAASVKYPSLEDQQSVESFDTLYSMLVVPYRHINSSRFRNVDETVVQAMSWFNASRCSGVPLIFHNIQTEPFVLELETSADADLSSIASTGTYGLQQSRGAASLYVLRAIRLWFEFEWAEVQVELMAREGETLLGVIIRRTKEGFCYVIDVVPGSAADRAGIKRNLDDAKALRLTLVVTRVGNERVLPWFIAGGKIKCFDVNSIISILTAYRLAGQPASLHLLGIKTDSTMSQMPEGSLLPSSPSVSLLPSSPSASVYNGQVAREGTHI